MVARHLIDLVKWPKSIQDMLGEGAFSVNIKPGKLNGLGIDEAHEMKSSKAYSSNILRVTEDLCLKTAASLNFGGPFSEKLKTYFEINSSVKDDYKRYEINVQKITSCLSKSF